MTTLQITLLGCGKMGSAMLKGWLADTSLDANFTIIEPNHDHLDWARVNSKVRIFADSRSAIADDVPVSSLIVLAVKPQMMEDAIASISSLRDSRTAFLTIAAGLSISWLRIRLGNETPILRAMPNTPAAIGKGITVLFNDDDTAHLVVLATKLLSTIGSVVLINDERLMDAVTAVSGSGPAYIFLLAEAMTSAGIAAGLPGPLSKQLAEATVSGAGALIEVADEPPSVLRENVTSKGGTTAAALSILMSENGLTPMIEKAVEAAKKRSIELGD